ncbi:MAG: hypothetical protein GWN86_14285 [Desulfobacterales bacterium]|nr:hypothetical protein [Desulfobacterales bacterium]
MPKQKDPIKPVEFRALRDPVKDRFGAYRHTGSHTGIDMYKERHTEVKAVLIRMEVQRLYQAL